MGDTADATATAPEIERGAYVKTLVLAALLGVPVAFAAVLFQTAIHDLIHFVWEYLPGEAGWDEPAWWYVILVPALAGLLVAAAVRLPGHGGHSPLEGIAMGDVRPVDLVSILPAALATLGLGLVLGPEAPLIAIGLAMGALAVQLVGMSGTTGHLLVLAGAFAAIAALFGGPLIAALLLFEMLAMSGAIPARMMGAALLPGFVAAGSGGLIFTGVAGWSGSINRTSRCRGSPTTRRFESSTWPGARSSRRPWPPSSSPPAAPGSASRGVRPCGRSRRSWSPVSSSESLRCSSALWRIGRSTSCCSRASPRCPRSSPRAPPACCSCSW